MPDLRFDGRVVVVTGAGAGLGRAYALLFAERGASVIVNDLGGSTSGAGSSSKAADKVVDEIRSKGGKAVADYNSVVDGGKIIQTALDHFGKVDVVVNNAGILRDRSFARISDDDWDLIHQVHLKGAFKVTQAAWPHFRKQNFGRVIVTSSNAALCGNFGQTNYSAAKMGLIGLSNTLAIEGVKSNINCNVLVPTAASRLTEGILPPDIFAELKPELIAPVVVWLCHESCQENGSIIESAGGWATKVQLFRGNGALLRANIADFVSPEDVRNNWQKVTDMSVTKCSGSIQEETLNLVAHLEALKSGKSAKGALEIMDTYVYKDKDVIMYALGIGCTTKMPSDLRYLYENHENFSAFPTFAIIPSLNMAGMVILQSSDPASSVIPGKTFDMSQILHGEQYLEVFKPIPTEGTLKTKGKVVDVLDKGKGAVLIVDAETLDEHGERISRVQMSLFVVGAGGFGGKANSENNVPIIPAPKRSPDASFMDTTNIDQAALYRLSGDRNPLHIDPGFAAMAGYKQPILHGLCSLGFSARHVMHTFADNDPALFKALKVRFAKPVLPGQCLKTNMWREGNRIHFETVVLDNSSVVLSGGYVDLLRVKLGEMHVKLNRINAAVEEDLVSEAVFLGMQERVDSNPKLAKSINGVFLYVITKNGKVVASWVADLKNGKVYKSDSPKDGVKVDTTITIDDNDMMEMAIGKLNPQVAFLKGKLKIKGNIMLAQKLKMLTDESKL